MEKMELSEALKANASVLEVPPNKSVWSLRKYVRAVSAQW